MRAWGNNTDRVLALLAECGPLTCSQIARALDLKQSTAAVILGRLRSEHARTPRRARICAWRMGDEVGRPYLRAVYELGIRQDVPKPEPIRNTDGVTKRMQKRAQRGIVVRA